MIGVSAWPSASSCERRAPTRPSIMSLGATASAPAAAWEIAVLASSSSVMSLSTWPSSRTTPQWPCEVYSHRHTSVITTSSGRASLMARTASWTTPSSSNAPEACSSLCDGMPNSSTAGTPSSCASAASSTAWEIDSRSMPGIASIGVRLSVPSSTNIGWTRCDGVSSVSRTMSRSRPVRRSRRMRVAGKAIAFSLRRIGAAPGGRAAVNAAVRSARCSSGPPTPPECPSADLSASSVGLNGNTSETTRTTV